MNQKPFHTSCSRLNELKFDPCTARICYVCATYAANDRFTLLGASGVFTLSAEQNPMVHGPNSRYFPIRDCEKKGELKISFEECHREKTDFRNSRVRALLSSFGTSPSPPSCRFLVIFSLICIKIDA